MEPAHHATSSSAHRAKSGASSTVADPSARAVVLVVAATLVGLGAGCGTTGATTVPVTSEGSPGVVSGSASASLPAPTGSAVPSPAGSASAPPYDASIGGIYQLASWDLAATDSVSLVIVAPRPSKRPHLDFVKKPGRLDIMLRDIRPVEAGSSVAGSSGIIARARLVFPPDDSLTILRLTLRDKSATNGIVVGSGARRLSPVAWSYTVTVQKAMP